MNVSEAMKKARSKHQESLKAQREKRLSRPASVTGIIQFFNDLYVRQEMGAMPPMKKEDKNKINGFIKFFKNNGYTDKEIYQFVENVFDFWSRLRNLDIYTDNRKKYILDTRPNLIDMIHCKTQIFQELNVKEEPIDDDNVDLLELWRNS